MFKIKPLRDVIFIKKIEEEDITKSGIVLSELDKNKKQILGEVLFVGPKTKETKVSDIILVNSYSFEECELDGEKYLAGGEKDVIGIKINDKILEN